MRESDTFLYILKQGEEKGAKVVLRRMGTKRFGVPDEATVSQLAAITDMERLNRLADRMLEATSWQDLLGTP